MELSVMNKEKEDLPAIGKPTASSREDTNQPSNWEVDKKAALRRFNPDVQITAEMMWHPLARAVTRKDHNHYSPTRVTWGHLFRQIVLGVIEILIPVAFIVGMIYWRAPWLFWAAVHFLRGEPVFNF